MNVEVKFDSLGGGASGYDIEVNQYISTTDTTITFDHEPKYIALFNETTNDNRKGVGNGLYDVATSTFIVGPLWGTFPTFSVSGKTLSVSGDGTVAANWYYTIVGIY